MPVRLVWSMDHFFSICLHTAAALADLTPYTNPMGWEADYPSLFTSTRRVSVACTRCSIADDQYG